MSLTVPCHGLKTVHNTKTALVVDDVDEMLDLLEIALSCAQFSVIRASSAEDARSLFETCADDIDLLMTEVRLGTDNGLELAKQLRRAKPSLQVLAMSGIARDRQSLSSFPGVEFLPKPFSASELRKKLDYLFPDRRV